MTSNPEEINVRDSCTIKDIAEWLGAKYEEGETSFRAVINEANPAKRIRITIAKAIPDTIYFHVAREGMLDLPVLLENVVRFTFQKQVVRNEKNTIEVRQIIFRTKKGTQCIVDDDGHIAFSG